MAAASTPPSWVSRRRWRGTWYRLQHASLQCACGDVAEWGAEHADWRSCRCGNLEWRGRIQNAGWRARNAGLVTDHSVWRAENGDTLPQDELQCHIRTELAVLDRFCPPDYSIALV